MIVYDLIREILGPYIQGCLLFGGLSRGQQLPDRLTALLTLKHPDVALFATHLFIPTVSPHFDPGYIP